MNLTQKSSFAILAALLSTTLTYTSAAQAETKFPTKELSIGMFLIKAEVAATPDDRAKGLMFRQKMPPNEGMVFDFEEPAQVCMWMKNTFIPLSVAFMSEDGKIINIEDMQPQTLDSHCSKKQARYALEMNLGWFKQKGIKAGMTVNGLPK